MSESKVQILLSTYNGSKYLDELMESILAQADVEYHLLVRDDGSTDQTVSKLRGYANKYPEKIAFREGTNQGAKGSFFNLIQMSIDNFDYFAFCDQDDIWYQKKLSRALTILKNESEDIPLMYCSSTLMVDSNLNVIDVWPKLPNKSLSLYNSLIENVAVGCTIVMNRTAMKLVKSTLPDNLTHIIMHDWWVYLCISSFGRVLFDNEPSILYRQHNDNVFGGQTTGIIKKWLNRLFRFLNGQNKFILKEQATVFLESYRHLLEPDQKKEIERFIDTLHSNIIKRWVYIINTPFYRQAFTDTIVFKLSYLLRRV